MSAPMGEESRRLRGRIAGASKPGSHPGELANLRSEFAASRLEDHIRELASSLTVAQVTRLVAVLLDGGSS